MVFSSYLFLFFFLPAALLGYYAVPRKWKHMLLLMSISFVMFSGYAEDIKAHENEQKWNLVWNWDVAKSRNITGAEQELFSQAGYSETAVADLRLPTEVQIKQWGEGCSITQSPGKSGWIFKSGKSSIGLWKSMPVWMNGFDTKIKLSVQNLSQIQDAVMTINNHDIGLNIHNTISVKKQTIPPKSSVDVEIELSIFEGFTMCMPLISLQGEILLKEYQIFSRPVPEIVCVEGTITECSALPALDKLDYPNCRFSARFNGFCLCGGDHVCKKELQLTIDGYKNYKLLRTGTVKVGDKIRCNVIPIDKLPDSANVIQVADDLALFDLDNYFCLSCVKIDRFSGDESVFADGLQEYTSIFDRHLNLPIPEELKAKQSQQIEKDLKKLNEMLVGYPENIAELNQRFQNVWEAEKAKDTIKDDGYNRVKANNITYVWRNMDNSFWCLPEKFTFVRKYPTISDENLQALLALKKCCEVNGVQLIISLVPDAYDMAARVINPELRNIPDYRTAIVARQLSEAGIETVYASDALIQNYNRHPFAYFMPIDGHPAMTIQDILTDIMAQRLERYHFSRYLKSDSFSMVERPHYFSLLYSNQFKPEFLFPANCDIGSNKVKTAWICKHISYEGKYDYQKPDILILGNSYIGTPYSFGRAYVAMLRKKMQHDSDCDSLGGVSMFTALINKIFSNPDFYLKEKKVCILQAGIATITSSTAFSNLETMDQYQKLMVGKTLLATIIPEGQTVERGNRTNLNKWLTLTDKQELYFRIPSRSIWQKLIHRNLRRENRWSAW